MSLHRRNWGLTLAAAAVSLSPVFCQTTSSGTTGTGVPSTGAGGTKAPTIPTIPTTTTPTTPTVTTPTQPTPIPITVSGRVMMEDGTPAPANVVLERVCSGTPHGVGFTDGEGYFSVRLSGDSLAAMQDASESSSLGRSIQGAPSTGTSTGSSTSSASGYGMNSRLTACDLRARLAGYRSQSIPLVDRKALDNPDVGTILLHRIGPNETGTVSAASLQVPKDARKAFQKGLDQIKKKKSDDAIASFHQAIALAPQYAEAWCELGKLQGAAGHPDEARQSFESAAKADPHWPDPVLEMALLAMYAHDWQVVADTTNRVLGLNSFSYPQAFYFNAVANYNLHHLDVAEKAARSAKKLDVRHEYPQSDFVLANIMVARHQYDEAAVELRSFLALAPEAGEAALARKQLDQIEHLSGVAANADRK